MMRKLFFTVFVHIVMMMLVAKSQTVSVPDFKFPSLQYDSLKDVALVKKIKQCTIKPTVEQQREILKNILDNDSSFKSICRYFTVIAVNFYKAFDDDMRKKYDQRISEFSADSSLSQINMIPMPDVLDSSLLNDFNYGFNDSVYGEYAFNCMDFDNDKIVDMITFGQVYFGPSPGLAFCGRKGDAFYYLYDCGGYIISFENKSAEKTRIRFIVPIIDESESNVLATLTFDKNSKSAYMESKLYYAQQTALPGSMLKPQYFNLNDSAYLRWSPVVNDKHHIIDTYGLNADDSLTTTLFGNAVGHFPSSAGGYVLAYRKNWAFVAFDANVLPSQISLLHGMDNTSGDFMSGWTFYATPEQYWCGWIEKKYIILKK